MANIKLGGTVVASESGGTVTLDNAVQDNITRLGTVTVGNLSNTSIVYPAGHVIQIIQYNNTTQLSTASTSWSTSNKVVFGTITPQFANSDILIQGHIATSANANAAYAFVDIYKNASDFTETANLSAQSYGLTQMNDACIWATNGYAWLDTCSENSTSEKTYGLSVRAHSSSGSATLGWGGQGFSVMVLQEIKR